MANTNIFAMADTWNNAATVFTAVQMNVTDTASQANSLLLDLQIGGVSKLSGSKTGIWYSNGVAIADYGVTTAGIVQIGPYNSATTVRINAGIQAFNSIVTLGANVMQVGASNLELWNNGQLAWSNSASITGPTDVALGRGGVGILQQISGTNAQILQVYQTFTDTVNYARAAINNTAGQVELAAESAGTGSANIDIKLTPKGTGNVSLPGGTLLKTAAALTNGAAAQTATLTNGPAAGNPTKWIPINDAGTTRYIPVW